MGPMTLGDEFPDTTRPRGTCMPMLSVEPDSEGPVRPSSAPDRYGVAAVDVLDRFVPGPLTWDSMRVPAAQCDQDRSEWRER